MRVSVSCVRESRKLAGAFSRRRSGTTRVFVVHNLERIFPRFRAARGVRRSVPQLRQQRTHLARLGVVNQLARGDDLVGQGLDVRPSVESLDLDALRPVGELGDHGHAVRCQQLALEFVLHHDGGLTRVEHDRAGADLLLDVLLLAWVPHGGASDGRTPLASHASRATLCPPTTTVEKSTFSRASASQFTSSREISVGGRRGNGWEAPPTSTSRRACARRTLLAVPPCSISLPKRWRAGCATGASARLATGTRAPPWTR